MWTRCFSSSPRLVLQTCGEPQPRQVESDVDEELSEFDADMDGDDEPDLRGLHRPSPCVACIFRSKHGSVHLHV